MANILNTVMLKSKKSAYCSRVLFINSGPHFIFSILNVFLRSPTMGTFRVGGMVFFADQISFMMPVQAAR